MALYKNDIVNVELESGNIYRSFMTHSIGEGDINANRFGIRVFRNGAPEAIGGNCTGFFIRADGETIVITNGTVTGNTAYVTLPEACYAVEGNFSLAIKCAGGNVTGTLRIVDGVVSRTSTDTYVDPGTVMPSIEELLNAIETAVESIPEDYDALMKTLDEKSVLISQYETRGKYINTYGAISSTSLTYAYAMPIKVERGRKYTFTGTGTTTVAAICKCDRNGDNRKAVYAYNADNVSETFVYEPEADGYIAVSYNYEQTHTLTSIDNRVQKISEKNENLANLDNIRIGENWTGDEVSNRAVIDVFLKPNTEYYIFAPVQSHIWGVSLIEKDGNNGTALNARTIYSGNGMVLETGENSTKGIIQINAEDGYTLTSSDFVDYPIMVVEGANNEDLTAIDSKARATFTVKDNKIKLDEIEIGKDWTGGTNANRAVVCVPVNPNSEYELNMPQTANWSTFSLVQKKDKWNVPIKAETIDTGTVYRFITESEAYWLYIQFNGASAITQDMFDNYGVYLVEGIGKTEAADTQARKAALGWKGKKAVWLGTSIPAAGKYGLDNRYAYPDMVGDILRAKVFNEAVGSSAVHCKKPENISASNPYGFLSNFEAVSRCLSNSLTEMEWIIEHFNDPAVFTQNVPQSLSNDDKEFIRSCSWEIKLQKYFESGKFPDVWVFDHGHNDYPTEETEATYTARTELSGTQHDGYYVNGSFVSSSQSSYLEFDVSGVNEVFLTETNGAGYDTFDLFDGQGTLLKYQANTTQRDVTDLLIDTSAAAILRISNPNTLISSVSVKKYTYGSMYNSLYSFQGAMDFLINKIKEYDPMARIILIGEYENQKFPNISYYQQEVAKRWEFPIYRQWENTGFSQQVVRVNGEYKTIMNVFIPDNLHPHTDTTGKTMKLIADNIAAWMNGIRP